MMKIIKLFTRNMKKTLELTLKQAQDIYKTADASVKEILEANFGKMDLIGRPLGVYCLTKDRRAVKAEDWDSKDTSIGVGVVTENTSFIVHLEPQESWHEHCEKIGKLCREILGKE